MRVALIETCNDCPHIFYEDRLYSCPKLKRGVYKPVNPDLPPPKKCPLLDLDVVLEEAKAENPYSGLVSDKYKSTKTGFDEGIEAVRAALKGGGE